MHELINNGTPNDRFESFKESYLKSVESNSAHPDRKDLDALKSALAVDEDADTPYERYFKQQEQDQYEEHAKRHQALQEHHAALRQQALQQLRSSSTQPAAGVGTVPATPLEARTPAARPGARQPEPDSSKTPAARPRARRS